MFLSESDNLSGLIDSMSHDDLNSLDDLDSFFDLKKAKNVSALNTECFTWPQPPWQPLFVVLIIKNRIFLLCILTTLSFRTLELVWNIRFKSQMPTAPEQWTCLQRKINKIILAPCTVLWLNFCPNQWQSLFRMLRYSAISLLWVSCIIKHLNNLVAMEQTLAVYKLARNLLRWLYTVWLLVYKMYLMIKILW